MKIGVNGSYRETKHADVDFTSNDKRIVAVVLDYLKLRMRPKNEARQHMSGPPLRPARWQVTS